MTTPSSAPPLSAARDSAAREPTVRGFVRWIGTSNPFYVISAALFLFGLRLSLGAEIHDVAAGALITGLAGYTLLLAGTALVLVRMGNVWDDVRTVLLVVVLMFLSTSVSFDELLVGKNMPLGIFAQLGGFAFAVLVSEVLLRGARVPMPAVYRGPYYLILGLFFLYPLILTPFLRQPRSLEMQFGLFLFSTLVGLALLTLVPAIRRGASAVHGAPWPWPLYPWTLFGLLAIAAPARSYLMCTSMHWLDMAQGTRTIFGAYFAAPLVLCAAVLVLEAGLVTRRAVLLGIGLAMPLAGLVLAAVGHQGDPIYQGFLNTFHERIGGDPLFVMTVASIGYYLYAGVRGAPAAWTCATVALAALALVGPDSLAQGLGPLQFAPLAVAAMIQMVVGIAQRSSARCFYGAAGLALCVFADIGIDLALRGILAAHIALILLAIIGAVFDDAFAYRLRTVAAIIALAIAIRVLVGPTPAIDGLPDWVVTAYPLGLGLGVLLYGWLTPHRPSLAIGTIVLSMWWLKVGWVNYRWARSLIAGLDQILMSLAAFAVAVTVSLAKSGVLIAWLRRQWWFAALVPAPTPGEELTQDESP